VSVTVFTSVHQSMSLLD